jgi:hypothetical protein
MDTTHTIKFKLHNVEIEANRVELVKEAWIEVDDNIIQEMPRDFGLHLSINAGANPRNSLLRWFKELFASNLLIGARYVDKNTLLDPDVIKRHECGLVAIALSIFSDYWFVAGVQYHTATDTQIRPQPSGGETVYFQGKGYGKVSICKNDETALRSIYDFVYEAFSNQDEERIQLIQCYSQSIALSDSVLTHRFPSLYGESDERRTVLYAALFFENVFAHHQKQGIENNVVQWNNHFPTLPLDSKNIQAVMNYRHVSLHHDASKAKHYLEEWARNSAISEDDLFFEIRKVAVKTVKDVMRIIALNYSQYQAYHSRLK